MLNKLTIREKEIYNLLVTKMSSKQIAHYLNISLATVSTYRNSIYEKLEYNDRIELIVDYYQTEIKKLRQFILDKGL